MGWVVMTLHTVIVQQIYHDNHDYHVYTDSVFIIELASSFVHKTTIYSRL